MRKKQVTFSTVMNNFKLAFGYVAIGWGAYYLSIYPGLASLFFPSSAIALGGILLWGNHLLPGVFLGALVLHILIFLSSDTLVDVDFAFIAIISISYMLQAFLGSYLISNKLRNPSSLLKDKQILFCLIIGGPISCLLGAVLITFYAYVQDLSYLPNLIYQGVTWWAGSSFGVMICLPVFFMFFAKNRSLWRARRKLNLFPLFIMLCVIFALYIGASRWERERNQFEFKEIASEHIKKLEGSFSSYVDAVASIERFYSSTSYSKITRADFRTFVKYILLNKKGINGLSWNPIILNSEREDFENELTKEGFKPSSIGELNENGVRIEAKERLEYVPVKYIEPMMGNSRALGFDVASNPARKSALDIARAAGQAQATSRITLIQEQASQAGFLLFYPVYSGGDATESERENNLLGFVVGVFRVGDITDSILDEKVKKKVHVNIFDITDGLSTPLYGDQKSPSFYQDLFKVTEVITLAGRDWVIEFFPTERYLSSHQTWHAWFWLLAGLFFTSLLGVFLLSVTARSHYLNRTVIERTAEIERNRKEIERNNKLLEERNEQLEASNVDLDQYAFVASHDLKSPLQAIEQLSGWVKEDNLTILPEASIKHLDTLQQRIKRMKQMLADLLLYSRVSRERFQRKTVKLQDLINQAIELSNVPETFIVECINCEQTIDVKVTPLELVIRNIISNAIKHHHKASGIIVIKYHGDSKEHRLSIRDDGPGIAPHLQSLATEMFNTLEPRDIKEGSGLGLSIVKKAILRLKGRMNIVSDGANGTRINLSWPVIKSS